MRLYAPRMQYGVLIVTYFYIRDKNIPPFTDTLFCLILEVIQLQHQPSSFHRPSRWLSEGYARRTPELPSQNVVYNDCLLDGSRQTPSSFSLWKPSLRLRLLQVLSSSLTRKLGPTLGMPPGFLDGVLIVILSCFEIMQWAVVINATMYWKNYCTVILKHFFESAWQQFIIRFSLQTACHCFGLRRPHQCSADTQLR